MPGLCECGCGRPTTIAKETCTSKGWIKGKPKRFVNGHNRATAAPRPIREVAIDTETGCWIWQRATTQAGYGVFKRDRKLHYAHRSYYAERVAPIPEGMQLHHLCMNRACCNPDHLVVIAIDDHTRLHKAKAHA